MHSVIYDEYLPRSLFFVAYHSSIHLPLTLIVVSCRVPLGVSSDLKLSSDNIATAPTQEQGILCVPPT
jgi:hypothetical protein